MSNLDVDKDLSTTLMGLSVSEPVAPSRSDLNGDIDGRSSVYDQITAGAVLLRAPSASLPSFHSLQEQQGRQVAGSRWVDLPALSAEERTALTEKQLGEDVVVIQDLSKEFSLPGREEKVSALKSLNLAAGAEIYPIRRGEFVMIRGPSGGGKTTLLNMIGTVDEPSHGSVKVFGEEINNKCSDAYLASLRLRQIGFVFQTFNLLSTMSAYENVALPLVINNTLSEAEVHDRVVKLLTVVGLQDRLSHLPSELSGGEQQRVTIARALSNRPQLLLLDEPTGDLDTRNTIEVMDLLLRINVVYGTTCIMVTHNPDLECYADRILYVEDGAFKKQAINTVQMRLNYEDYMRHLSQNSHLED